MVVLAIVRALILIFTMTLWLTAYGLKSLFIKHSPERAFGLRKHWLNNIAIKVMNIDVKIEGMPGNQPAIYVCNHRSFIDPVIVCAYLDAFVIAKAEVADYPIISKGAEVTGVVYVKRENKDSRNSARDMMIELVGKGYNVLVFPEGTVGVNKTTIPFRAGTFFEAAENNVAIVPMALEFRSEKDLWTVAGFLKQYIQKFSKWKTEAKLSFGPVLIDSDGEQLKNAAQDWIDSKLTEMQKDWSTVDFAKYENFNPLYKYKDL